MGSLAGNRCTGLNDNEGGRGARSHLANLSRTAEKSTVCTLNVGSFGAGGAMVSHSIDILSSAEAARAAFAVFENNAVVVSNLEVTVQALGSGDDLVQHLLKVRQVSDEPIDQRHVRYGRPTHMPPAAYLLQWRPCQCGGAMLSPVVGIAERERGRCRADEK